VLITDEKRSQKSSRHQGDTWYERSRGVLFAVNRDQAAVQFGVKGDKDDQETRPNRPGGASAPFAPNYIIQLRDLKHAGSLYNLYSINLRRLQTPR